MRHASKSSRTAQAGLSIVELLVALAISSVLIVGAVYMYSQSRSSFTVSETVARLQENGRYALSVIEPEIQLAGYYGFSNSGGDFRFRAAGGAETPIADMRQTRASFAGVPSSVHACGDNFVLDLYLPVQGANDSYDFAPNGANCAADGGGALANTDTVVVRRASTGNAVADPDRIQVYINRLEPRNQLVFQAPGPTIAPGPVVAGRTEVRNLVVNGYYIAQNSDSRPGTPALRVKFLAPGSAGQPAFDDEEIMSGIEDLQVQFGVDLGDDDDGDGNPDDLGGDGLADKVNGRATRYVDPGAVILASAQVVSVRLWVLVRAEQPEVGYVNNTVYTYGSRIVGPLNDGFRRVVMSRTVFLRNSRSLPG